MKYLNKCFALFLCIIMILSESNTVFAVNSTNNSEDVQVYSVPIISNEYDDSHVTFYGIGEKYYLSFDVIKKLTRFELAETDTTITLTQGLRELVIEKSSGHLVDCNLVNQGDIDIILYDGKYLCEGIPMLRYLGAACTLKENLVLEVMMPTITIWESIMPDYLDYYFNITELYGGEDNVKISLACDIIADVLDGVSGHGLFTNGDTHLEDALYEILNVDMMKYDSVQEIVSAQNQKINDFLSSAVFETMLDTGDNMYDAVYEALDYYSKFYVAAKNDILLDTMTKTDDLDYASELASQIKAQVYDQSATKANLKNAKKAQSFMDIGMLAFDTAITSYSMMQYNDDTKNIFARTINQEMFKYANYYDISWNKVSDKISNTLKSTQSIVADTAIDNVTKYVVEKVTEKSAKTALSAFTSKANIYTAAIQIGSFIASLINYESNQAFSADMNAIWLNVVQYDIAQLTSHMFIKERDEYHFSDTESLTKLKDMFTLYYRTIIAFSENITKSIEGFGGKNRSEWMQYFGGTSGNSVCNYAAKYLYRITNCAVVPIVEYTSLSDQLLTTEWISQFIMEESSNEWKEAYINYVNEHGNIYDSFGHSIEIYKLVNINDDSIPELYINFGTTADGDVICTYYDGKVVEQPMWNYGFSYLGGQNIFRDTGGHMDVYHDKIYSIENGQFVLLHEGKYGAIDNSHVQFNSDGKPIYNYYWDGIEVSSETEYMNLLNEVYNAQQAITPFDGAEYDSKTWRYVGNDLCDYEEIIEAIDTY